jgi:hypothetical protein
MFYEIDPITISKYKAKLKILFISKTIQLIVL